MRVHHFAIKSKDPAALARFYASMLGLAEQKRHHDEKGLRSVWFTLGDAILMIERSEVGGSSIPFEQDPPGLHLVAFTIDPNEAPNWRSKLIILKETQYSLYF